MDSGLAEFRRIKHMTLREMADITGTSQSLYNKYEYCERRPSFEFLGKFAKAFPDADIRQIFFA